jgi:hypothetical protein
MYELTVVRWRGYMVCNNIYIYSLSTTLSTLHPNPTGRVAIDALWVAFMLVCSLLTSVWVLCLCVRRVICAVCMCVCDVSCDNGGYRWWWHDGRSRGRVSFFQRHGSKKFWPAALLCVMQRVVQRGKVSWVTHDRTRKSGVGPIFHRNLKLNHIETIYT